MYANASYKDILLWCDGKDSSTGRKRKICLAMKRTCIAQASILLALLQKRKSLKNVRKTLEYVRIQR